MAHLSVIKNHSQIKNTEKDKILTFVIKILQNPQKVRCSYLKIILSRNFFEVGWLLGIS